MVDARGEERHRLILLLGIIVIAATAFWIWDRYGSQLFAERPVRQSATPGAGGTRPGAAARNPPRAAAPEHTDKTTADGASAIRRPAAKREPIRTAAVRTPPQTAAAERMDQTAADGASASRRPAVKREPIRTADTAPPASPAQAARPKQAAPVWTVERTVGGPARTVTLTGLLVRSWKLGAAERRIPLFEHRSACALPKGAYPPQEGPVWYGRIQLAGRKHCVAVTGWPGPHPWLWFDAAGDGLDNDEPVENQGSGKLAARLHLPMPDPIVRGFHPANREYTLWAWLRERGGRPSLYYYPTVELEGTVTLEGETRKVVIAERHDATDGDFTDDGVYVDLDGDGKIDSEEYVPPAGLLRLPSGTRYRFVIASGGGAP